MTLDGLAVACLAREMHDRLLGHRVQHVHHTGQDALALECYGSGRRSWLVACTHPAHPAAFIAEVRPPRPSDEVTPLMLRLRKFVDGAVVAGILAPALERILRIDLDARVDEVPRRITLIVELLGPGSLVIMVDGSGTILESSRRIAPTSTARTGRLVSPRAPYVPPPAPDRLDPRTLDGGALAAALADADQASVLADLLVRRVGACSPLLAREVVWEGCGESRAAVTVAEVQVEDLDRIAATFRDRWARANAGAWEPHLHVPADVPADGAGAGRAGRPAFAPFPLRTVPSATPVRSLSEAVAAWHAHVSVGDPRAAEAIATRALRQAVEGRLDKARARQFSLARSLADQADVSGLRAAGDWLLAYPDGLTSGATTLTVDPRDVGRDGPLATVSIDPAIGAIGNSQRLFRRYQKARAAAREVPPRLEAATREREYLEEALVHLDFARGPDGVRTLRDELAAGGFVSAGRRAPNRGTRAPNRGTPASARLGPSAIDRLTLDGFEVLVGRSGRGNDEALRTRGHPDDPWLHARGVAGAHVLVLAGGRAVPEEVVRMAAAVAAGRSASRGAGIVAVDCTLRRHVARVPGGPPGLVTYRNERTIPVAPAVTE